jgi:hypothetical protein
MPLPDDSSGAVPDEPPEMPVAHGWIGRSHAIVLLSLVLLACAPRLPQAESFAARELPSLRVSDNGRYLLQVRRDGSTTPFFWLGDTAWNLHRLDAEEIDHYLTDRAAKGFNLIQGPVLDWAGLEDRRPLSRRNAYGHEAYLDGDSEPRLHVDRPGEGFNDYFDQTDYLIRRAAELGMYVALLPFWAQGINQIADGPEGLARLQRIGALLGSRYRDASNVLWIVGGEAASESPPEAVHALARGLEEGHEGQHLMTVHPGGARSSSSGSWRARGAAGEYDYHAADWLDFNMLQSGHGHPDRANYLLIEKDYARTPPKPTLEDEYWYERGYPDEQGRVATAHDQRKGGYWSVFAGGFGYTYGANGIWQFSAGDEPWDENDYRSTDRWRVALEYEGSDQMVHLRRLMESRPFLSRIADQSLILEGGGGSGDGASDHVRATRDGSRGGRDASYLMVYLPEPVAVVIDTRAIDSERLDAWWYDPRSGEAAGIRRNFPQTGSLRTPAREHGPDWVLVIDDANAGFAPPGGDRDAAEAAAFPNRR